MTSIQDRFRALVDARADVKTFDETAPLLHGYIGLAYCELPTVAGRASPFDFFQTTVVVPPPPSRSEGQTIFLFPGVQPSRNSAHISILQPVLQWGPSAAGGGNSWTVQSYYIRGTPQTGLDVGAYSARRDVAPGQRLDAVIKLETGPGASGRKTYFYSSDLVGIEGTFLGIDVPEPFVQVGLALEVYNGPTCAALPSSGSLTFESVLRSNGAPVSPAWGIRAGTMCSFTATAVDRNGVQEIAFGYNVSG